MALLAHAGVDHALIVLVAVSAVALYALARRRQPAASVKRMAAWIGGVTTVVLASSPPFERLGERTFTGHMVQHLLTIIVAGPLLVVARPFATVGRAAALPAWRTGRALAHRWRRASPALGPATLLGVLYVTHLTSIYEWALQNRWIHEFEHAGYLAGAVALWAVLLTPGRSAPVRVGGVFAVVAGSAFLAMILMSADQPLVATYAARLGPRAALVDQRSAAALMWVSGVATTLPLLLLSVWRWAATEERVARQVEAITPQR